MSVSLNTCIYPYMYVCRQTCIYIICTYMLHTYFHTHMHINMSIHVCMPRCMGIYVCMYVHRYTYYTYTTSVMDECMHVQIYAYVCIYPI